MRINVLDVFIISLQGGSVSKVDGKPTHDMTDIEGISLILGDTGRACEAEGLGGVPDHSLIFHRSRMTIFERLALLRDMDKADPEETQLIHIAADGVRGWWQR